MAIEGGYPKKYKGKRGDKEKYSSKTMKWHNVFILKKTCCRLNKRSRRDTKLLQTFLLLTFAGKKYL